MNSLAVSAEEQRLYQQHFLNANPIDGRLPGAAARANLMQSGLPTHQLGQIWELADIDRDGALDFDEYCIALKLVFSLLNRAIDGVPPELPPSLIPQSKYRHFTGNSGASNTSPAHIVSPQLSSPGASAGAGAFGHQPLSGGALEWYVPGADRARYQGLFAQHARGSPYVRMLDVDELLGSLGIPRAAVTQAWALVDVRKYQQLNQEQFIYLMHVLGAHSRGVPLPGTLPSVVKDAIYSSLSLDGGPGAAAASPGHGYSRGKPATAADPRKPGLYGERSGNVALADSYLSKLKSSSTFKNDAGSRYASPGKCAEEERQLRDELRDLDEQAEKLRADYDRLGRDSRDEDPLGATLRELEELKAHKEREKRQAEESQPAAAGGGHASESVQDIKQSIFHLEGHLSFLQSGRRAMD
ncbi:endocytosis defective- protein, partial [Coemansia biformis]